MDASLPTSELCQHRDARDSAAGNVEIDGYVSDEEDEYDPRPEIATSFCEEKICIKISKVHLCLLVLSKPTGC